MTWFRRQSVSDKCGANTGGEVLDRTARQVVSAVVQTLAGVRLDQSKYNQKLCDLYRQRSTDSVIES
jgi:hypothetical protein